MGAPFRLLCNAPSIYPSLPQYTTYLFYYYVRRFQNLPPPSQNITLFPRDPHSIYPSLPESRPLFYNCMQQSHNLPLPPRIYPPPSTTICNPPRICPSLSQYTPLSTTKCDAARIYPSIPEYTPPLFPPLLCDFPRIYRSLPEKNLFYNPPFHYFLQCSHNLIPEYTPLLGDNLM